MTNEIDRDNEDWLLGLSGEPRREADSFTNAQSEAIRAALKRRSGIVDKDVPEASDAGLHRLLFRLKREGFLEKRKAQASNDHSFLSKPLAIAAVFFLGAIVVFHTYQLNEESQEIAFKGTGSQVVVRVSDPDSVVDSIVKSLDSKKIEFELNSLPRGTKQLVIKASPEAVKILNDHKISIKPDGQTIDVLIEVKK